MVPSWTDSVPPNYKTGAQVTLVKALSQNKIQKLATGAAWRRTCGHDRTAYLPDLILVQLRVMIRCVAAGRSAIAYSLDCTSADG